MAFVIPMAGAAIAVAGGDKLAGQRGYRRMFSHLGWSARSVRLAAAAELAGGLLMVPRTTRRLGGLLVAAVSAAVLTSELRHDDRGLAASRGAVMLAGLLALALPD